MCEYNSEYEKPYFILLKAIDDALEELKDGSIGEAKIILIRAQLDAEEAYASFGADREEIGNTTIINLFKEK